MTCSSISKAVEAGLDPAQCAFPRAALTNSQCVRGTGAIKIDPQGPEEAYNSAEKIVRGSRCGIHFVFSTYRRWIVGTLQSRSEVP